LDDPSDLDPGVYHALLLTARKRELITEKEFSEFVASADLPEYSEIDEAESELTEKYWKCPACHNVIEMEYDMCWNCQAVRPVDVEHPEIKEILESADESDLIENEKSNYWKCPSCQESVEMEFDICWNCQKERPSHIEHPEESEYSSSREEILEAEKERHNYWKCPNCHEMVEMDFEICWSCQTEKPVNIEYPERREILSEKNLLDTSNPVKSGFILIAFGILVFLLEYFWISSHVHLYRLVIAGIMVLAGIVFVLVGIAKKL